MTCNSLETRPECRSAPRDARLYDIEAFLGVPHHPHNAAVISAWLDGTLSWAPMRAWVSGDEAFLDTAVA